MESIAIQLILLSIFNSSTTGSVHKKLGLKVVGNEKEGGSGKCQTFAICLRPRRLRFFSLLISLSSLILCISVLAPVKQNE
jgi:hypothetical protein